MPTGLNTSLLEQVNLPEDLRALRKYGYLINR